MIGSGVFLLPASLAFYGGISIFGWLITTIGSVLLSLLFMSLSRKMPNVGGPYAYAKAGFGDFTGFIVAWGYWISILCGNAAISVACVSYLSVFSPVLSGSPFFAASAAMLIIWILTIANSIGVHLSGRIQLVSMFLKLIPLLAIALFGLFYFNPDNFIPLNVSGDSNISAITASAALTLWAFLGLESATIPADNIKNPKAIIPRATITGTMIAAFVYVLSTIAVMGVISPETLAKSNAPFSDAATIFWGSAAGYFVAAGGVVSCFGALNGWILLQGQVPYAAAKDRLMHSQFSTLSNRGVPVFGLIVSSVIITFLMFMNYTESLVEKFTVIILLATLATLLPYIVSALAEIKFNLKNGGGEKSKNLKNISIALLAFIYSCWAVAGIGFEAMALGLLFISTGIPFYFIWRRGRQEAN